MNRSSTNVEFSNFSKDPVEPGEIAIPSLLGTYRTSELPASIRTLHTCTGRHMHANMYCWHRQTLVTRGWQTGSENPVLPQTTVVADVIDRCHRRPVPGVLFRTVN